MSSKTCKKQRKNDINAITASPSNSSQKSQEQQIKTMNHSMENTSQNKKMFAFWDPIKFLELVQMKGDSIFKENTGQKKQYANIPVPNSSFTSILAKK